MPKPHQINFRVPQSGMPDTQKSPYQLAYEKYGPTHPMAKMYMSQTGNVVGMGAGGWNVSTGAPSTAGGVGGPPKSSTGGGAAGGVGTDQAPGYIRSFYGFLGREQMRQAGRTGQKVDPRTLTGIQRGYGAASADYGRMMQDVNRYKEMMKREQELGAAGQKFTVESAQRAAEDAARRKRELLASTTMGTGALMMGPQQG